jgi:hypothetical protein
MTWSPSPDPYVIGYNIYYGTVSGDYTNMISVGDVTNATINNLEPDVTYYFVATSFDNQGNVSPYSNEAVFSDYTATSSGIMNLQVMAPALTTDQVTYSLAAGSPAAATINPDTGILSWNSTLGIPGSTNDLTVLITDLTNPGASTEETLLITVPDYLSLAAASVPVQTGESASLPLTAVSSGGATNLVITLDWPGNQLFNPTLTFNAPVAGGVLVNQGTNLSIQVWTANGETLAGTNQFAQINFQAAAGQTSAFLELPIISVSANNMDGSTVTNAIPAAGEVVVIGTNPLLLPGYSPNTGRVLTIYANPGVNYEIECTTDLASANSWQLLENYQPTNIVESVNLDSANPTAFYRLQQE